MNNKKTDVQEKKSEYSSAIGAFAGKLNTVKDRLTTVKTDISNLSTSVTGYVSESINVSINSSKDEVKEKRLDLEDKLSRETDATKRQAYQKQIDAYKDTEVNLSNTKTVNEKAQSAFEDGMEEMNDNIGDFDEGIYSSYVSVLNALRDTVDEYDTSNISAKLNKNDYYKSVDNILNSETVKHAEEEMVKEYAKSSIWSIIKTIVGFFKLCAQ